MTYFIPRLTNLKTKNMTYIDEIDGYDYDVNEHIKVFNLQKHISFNLEDIKGWNTDFIIYGSFIHNALLSFKFITISEGKIDFAIFTENGYQILLNFFNDNYKNIKYNVFKNGVELIIETETETEIVIELNNFIGHSIESVLNTIKFECHKCYFDGKNIIVYPECIKTINTGVIEKMNGNNTNFTKREFMECYNYDYKFSIDIYKKLDIIDIRDGRDAINNGKVFINVKNTHYEVEYYKLTKYEDRGFDIYLEFPDNDDDYYNILIKFSNLKQLMVIMPLIYKYPFTNTNNEEKEKGKDNKDGLTNSDIIYFLINQNITMKQVT